MDYVEVALINQNEGIRNATKLVNSRTGVGDLTNNPNTTYYDVSFEMINNSNGDIILSQKQNNPIRTSLV